MKAKIVAKDQYYITQPTSMPGGGPASSIYNTNLGVHNLDWVKGSVKSDGKVAELTWGYETNFAASLVDFSIYQKIDQSVTFTNPGLTQSVDPNPFVLIRTVSKKDAQRIAMANGKTGYMVFVEGINPEKYVSLVPLVPDPKPGTGGGSSPTTSGPTQVASPFIYKIIANHSDGGWSHEAVSPLVKTQ